MNPPRFAPTTTTVSTEGQIVLPASLRSRGKIAAGQRFHVERLDLGRYSIKKVEEPKKHDVVDWLLSCPVKGFFDPLPLESTDTL